MAPSEHDLKSQLSDIQKRLSEATLITPKRTGSLRKDLNDQDNENSPSKGQPSQPVHDHSRKSIPGFLSKKDKRVSLPPLDSSISPRVKNSGKDMDFVVGLSENLLLECRRLQADNHSKSSKLKTLEEEFTRLKTTNANLMTKFNERLQNEEQYRDTNWELELKLQQLSQEFKTLSENYNKSQKELKKQMEYSSEIRSELEQVNLNKVSIEKEFSTHEASVSNEIQALKSHVNELNEENSQLNDEIEDLRRKVQEMDSKPDRKSLSSIPVLKPQTDSESDDEYNEPPISPVKTIGMNNTALETETLKSSLSSAHQTIAKLRQQIFKLRSNELSNKSSNQLPGKKNQSPVIKKPLKNLTEAGARAFLIKGNTNRESRVIYDDSFNDSDIGDWENFEGDSTSIGALSSPSRSRPVSTAQDLIDDSDSDLDEIDNLGSVPLSSELQVISESDVAKYAEEHELVIVPLNEYEQLQTGSILSEEVLAARADERGLKIVSYDDHKSQLESLMKKEQEIKLLTAKSDDLQKVYERETSELKAQLEKTRAEIKQENSLVKQLEAQIETPSSDYLREKASKLSLCILPVSEFSLLKEQAQNPTTELLKEKAASKSLKVISDDEHASLLKEVTFHADRSKKLQELIDNPSAEYIKDKAALSGLVALDKAQYEIQMGEMKSSITTLEARLTEAKVKSDKRAETANKLIQDLKEKLSVSQKEHFDASKNVAELKQLLESANGKAQMFKSDLENPSHDYLTEKSSKQGFVMLPKLAHVSLLEKANKSLQELAKESNHVVLKEEEHRELVEKATNPSVELLSSHAKAHNHRLVHEDHYSGLVEESSKSIEDHAREHDVVLVKSADYEDLKRRAENPSVDEISVKAETIGHVVVPSDEYAVMSTKASKSIHDLAEEENMAVISKEDHQELVRKAETPSVTEMKTAAASLGFVSLRKEEHSELVARSRLSAEDLAKESNSVVISKDEHSKLVSIVESPDVEYLASKAKLSDHVLLHKDDHDALMSKSAKPIEDLAKEQNMHVLTAEKLNALESPPPAVLIEKSLAAGLVAIPLQTHEDLLSKSQAPTLDHISSKAELLGHVVISKIEYDQLLATINSPPKDFIAEKASAIGMSLVPSIEFSSMQNELAKLKVDLSDGKLLAEKVSSDGNVVLKKDDYDNLVERANRTIDDFARAEKKIVIDESEYQEVVNPTREKIAALAASHQMVVIPQNEHHLMLRNQESPSIEHLKQKSLAHGHVVVPKEHYERVKENSESPSVEFLTEKVRSSGSVILSIEDHEALKKRAAMSLEDLAEENNRVTMTRKELETLQNPDLNQIKKIAQQHSHVAIKADEFEGLQQSLVDLQAKASKSVHELASDSGLVVLPETQYDELVKPSKDDLLSKVSALGFVPIAAKDHQKLIKPTTEDIERHAKSQDMVLLSNEDYASLKQRANKSVEELAKESGLELLTLDELKTLQTPSSDQLKALAGSAGLVAIPTSTYELLLDPPLETLVSKADEKGHSIIPKEKLVDLESISNKTVHDLAQEEDAVVLSKESLDRLMNPSKDTVVEYAAKVGLVTLSHDDHHLLSSPTREIISAHAEREGLKLVTNDDYDSLVNPSREVLAKHAVNNDSVLVAREEYNSLVSPSQDTIRQLADGLGFSVVPADEYESLKLSYEKPSAEYIAKHASEKGFAVLSKSNHDELIKKASRSIDDLAKEKNMVLIDQSEYDELNKKKLDKQTIERHADEIDCVVVDKKEYERATSLAKNTDASPLRHVTVPKTNKVLESAKSLGFVPVAAAEYKHLIEHQKDHVVTKSDIYQYSKDFDLAVLPADDYKRMLKDRTIKEDVSLGGLEEQAKRWGMKLVPVSQANISPFMQENKSTSTFNESEFTDALSRVPSNTSTIDGKMSTGITVDELRIQAMNLGYKLSPLKANSNDADPAPALSPDDDDTDHENDEQDISDEFSTNNDTVVLKDDKAELIKRVEEFGLVVLDTEGLEKVKNEAISTVSAEDVVTSENLPALGESLGFRLLPISEEHSVGDKSPHISDETEPVHYDRIQLDRAAEKLGCSIVSSEELDALRSSVTDISKDAFIEKAQNLNLIAVEKDVYDCLMSKAESADDVGSITRKLEERGMAIIPAVELEKLKNIELSEEEVVSKGSQLGLGIIPLVELERLKSAEKEKTLLSRSDVVESALEFGLVPISKEELEDLRAKAASNREMEKKEVDYSSDYPSLTKEEVEASARNHGLLAIPEDAFVATNISRIPDVNNVVILPVTYYNKLTKSEAFSLDKITNDELQSQAKKRGFTMVTGNHDHFKENVPSKSVARKSTTSSLTSSSSRRNLAEASHLAANQEFDSQSSRLSRASSRAQANPTSRSGSVPPPVTRDFSVDGGVSLMTYASLSEPNIIPALTQTVIGEYLFKYYRRLGPFSSISESRHERYFCVNPYTMTLYWSSTSPILGNPSAHKTKAAAIIGVESVDDNNPLPTGLYHKSIIVRSETRSIKFTCSTRQRHNIWYNSLRYLIQRNMEGIDFDEDFDLLQDRTARR